MNLNDLLITPLKTPDDLHHWVRLFCNLDIPRTSVCAHHTAPFEYLRRAYFEPSSDQVVHAPRGGGKTRLAAVATLLDLLHKPGIQVRILGGSLEQSMKMWEHLLPDLQGRAPHLMPDRGGSSRRLTLTNRSSVAVLTQSQRAVRGLRVQKIRCDEVELFKPDIWEAAQLATRSFTTNMIAKPPLATSRRPRGNRHRITRLPIMRVSGAIDALSTLHSPSGLMQRVIDDATASGTPVVRWCILDVLERCPAQRDCGTCELWSECQGRAKTHASGFVTIDDAIRMKRRVSKETWDAEMLCNRPSVRGAVYPNFDPLVHVKEVEATGVISLAIDFGFAAPFVCLWVCITGETVNVIDEYVQPGRTMDEHLRQIAVRPWPRASYIACDPAGAGQNDQTAASNVQLLRRAGYEVRSRASRIVDGIELIRLALKPAEGPPRLFIHPRCTHLIKSISGYRYPTLETGSSELPLKDGTNDHACDALRYWFINQRNYHAVKTRSY